MGEIKAATQFPFRKRSMPYLTVDIIISNQAVFVIVALWIRIKVGHHFKIGLAWRQAARFYIKGFCEPTRE